MTSKDSSVTEPSRAIPSKTRLFLYVHAGGRCEFDGCNKYLLEHYPTETAGNFGEQAHIWAFSEKGGPRGKGEGRPQNINSLSNLMLLCKECHDLVDKNPEKYTVETLKKFKKAHEDRIHGLTGISKDRDTIPVILRGLINDRLIDISDEEMQEAVAPNYLKRREKIEIDLTSIPDSSDEAYWKIAVSAIDRKIERLYSLESKPNCTLRVSVFAMAPIPLLVYLGSKLTDKIDVDLYQRHRNPETWMWSDMVDQTTYTSKCIIQDDLNEPVSLFINLSGKNDPINSLPCELENQCSVYELTLEGQEPTPLFLNTRDDLNRFTSAYLNILAMIRRNHPNVTYIHLFPAVPAPIAIVLGRSRLPKVDPSFKVYDRDKRAGGFVSTLEII
jgi:SMODS-associated and fused to various effectors sensor domain